MKTTNNDDNRITVGFDKSKWSVESPESFGEVMGILKTLFRLNNSKIEKYSLSGHRKIRKYTNGPDSVQIYYSPTDISQPSARMVNNSSNNRLSFFKISSEELLKDNFTVEISNNRTSMNIGFPEDINNPTTNDTTLDKKSSKVIRKVVEDNTKINNLLNRLDTILTKLGYKFQNDGPVKSTKPKYKYVTTFRTDWFRIYINHSSFNPDLDFKFATIQIDGFKKEKKTNSYWVLLLILKILKSYRILEIEDSYECPILPSQMEISFDFHGYEPEFLFELTSSINCRKQAVWWSNKPKTKNPYTVEDDKNSLLSSTHYIGLGEDDNYQVTIYNKPKVSPKFTRLEFRIKRKGLRPKRPKKSGPQKLRIDSVEDLFTKHWILDFLKKITFARPNKKLFERIDSAYHPLADISLKSFIDKVPTEKQETFSRDCLKQNTELTKKIVDAANGFHEWLNDLYKTSSILVSPRYKIEDTFEVVSDDDSIKLKKYPVAQYIDLKELFRQLPANTTIESQELKDAIRFSIFDNQHNLLAYIIVGESPERFMEPGDVYFIEHFKDVFSKPKSSVQVDMAGF